jgi:hypothetical protein
VRYWSIERGLPAGGPIANALVVIVGSLVIAASIFVGFLAFLILGSLLLIIAAVVSIRLWWLRRKLAKGSVSGPSTRAGSRGTPRTIEGEYHVVIEDKERRPR